MGVARVRIGHSVPVPMRWTGMEADWQQVTSAAPRILCFQRDVRCHHEK